MKIERSRLPFYKRISFKTTVVTFIIFVIILAINTVIATNFSRNRLLESGIQNIQDISEEKALAMEQYILDQKVMAYMIKINSTIVEQAMLYDQTGEINPVTQASVMGLLTELYNGTNVCIK